MNDLTPKSAAANGRRAFRLRVAGDLTLAPALHRRAPAAVAELGSLDDITRMASEPPKDFTVKFGKYAHTVEYDDPEAHILFTFDIDGPQASLSSTMPQACRVIRGIQLHSSA